MRIIQARLDSCGLVVVVWWLVVYLVVEARVADRTAPTLDEPAHLVAGITYLSKADLRLYRENPPLPRVVAALPAIFLATTKSPSIEVQGLGVRPEFVAGRRFFSENYDAGVRLLRAGRRSCLIFGVMGALSCFLWSYECFGLRSGVTALVLWCSSPNLLAHGALLSPDGHAASMAVMSGYLYWRWTRSPNWSRTLSAAIGLALALLTKSTLLVLIPLWIVLPFCNVLSGSTRRSCSSVRMLAVIVIGALYLVNAAYAFDGTGRSLSHYRFVSARMRLLQRGIVGRVPVPLPRHYVLGIDSQCRAFESPPSSYLRGVVSHSGWWYYYLYVSVVKLPVGTLALAFIAVCRGCKTVFRSSSLTGSPSGGLIALVHAGAIMAFVSAQATLSQHGRYALPALPFAFVWVSAPIHNLTWRPIQTIALAATVCSSVWTFPHYLSYFNEFAGGPRSGPSHLINSNIDWGQDLVEVAKWRAEHPKASFYLAYYGGVNPGDVGLKYRLPPLGHTDDVPVRLDVGYYAISVNFVYGYPFGVVNSVGVSRDVPKGAYSYFRRAKPVAYLGYSIYLYHIEHH